MKLQPQASGDVPVDDNEASCNDLHVEDVITVGTESIGNKGKEDATGITSASSDKVIRRASLTFQRRRCWEGAGNLTRPFYRYLGLRVARRPVTAIALTFAFSTFCGLGLLRLERAKGYRIWQDTSTAASQQFQWISETWPDEYSTSKIILVQEQPDANILTQECLAEAARLRDAIKRKLPSSLCKSSDGVCERSLLHTLEHAGSALSNATDFLAQSQSHNGDVLPFYLTNIVGGVCCSVTTTKATALRIEFHTLPKQDAATVTFEEEFLETCQNWSPASRCSGVRVHCLASSSYEIEQKRSMISDTNLMTVAIQIMIVYMAVALGRACNCVQSKVLLGTSVIVSVGFSFAISFGIGALVGIKFSQMSLLAIFILLGVGIDDAFVINDAFERSLFTDEIDLRLAAALEEVGPSVFLTSATDFVAFLVGIFFPIDAIAYFCMTAAIAVFSIFLMQTTWFAALLVLNARRQAASRCDVCPCFPAGRCSLGDAGRHSPDESSANGSRTAWEAPSAGQYLKFPWLEHIFHPLPMAVVALLFVSLAVASIWLASNEMQKGTKSSDYLPSGSYVSDYWAVEKEHFGARNAVMVIAKQLNLASVSQINAYQETLSRISSLGVVIHPPEPTWLDAYTAWRDFANGNNGSLLQDFVASSFGRRYRADLVSDPKEGINTVAARAVIWVRLEPPEQKHVQVKAMREMRKAYDEAMRNRLDGFIWAGFFIGADAYENLDHLLITSISVAIAAIGVVCFILLPPLVAGMTLISIAFVNIDILGMLCLWRVSIGTAMIANLVMALGFSVDYSAHIADAFCVRVKTEINGLPIDPAVAMARALRTTGISVMHAGVSTLLAVVVLAFSTTKGFQDLFKCFLLMVSLGLLHSMVFLPLLLVAFERFMRCCRARLSA